jgi:hypothetical protein
VSAAHARWTWPAGVAAAVALVGRGLASGYPLSLDLVTAPRIPVPRGIWGLGPYLPRRVPLGLNRRGDPRPAFAIGLALLVGVLVGGWLVIVVPMLFAFPERRRRLPVVAAVTLGLAGCVVLLAPGAATWLGRRHLQLAGPVARSARRVGGHGLLGGRA